MPSCCATSDTTSGSAATTADSPSCAEEPLEVQLFYRYVQLPDPEAVVTQLRCLCEELGLSGRMRIATEGINGILCGKSEQLARFRAAMQQPGSPLEGLEVQYKLSAAGASPPQRRSPQPHCRSTPPPPHQSCRHRTHPSAAALSLPPPPLGCLATSCLAIAGDGDPMGGELYVRVTDELTATGDTVKPHLPTVLGGAGGKHLCAHDFHEALSGPAGSADAPATAGAPSLSEGRRRRVVIDTRNHFETAVGSFEGAIDPKIRTFSQFPSWVEANLEQLDGADVYMYCTGGPNPIPNPSP